MSSLIKQCQKLITQLEKNRKEVFTYSGANVEIMNDATRLSQSGGFPFETHLNLEKLKCYLSTGEASDVNIYIAGYGLVARAHKLILSLRSPPFAKVILHLGFSLFLAVIVPNIWYQLLSCTVAQLSVNLDYRRVYLQ